jgi:citrate lyase synthetase
MKKVSDKQRKRNAEVARIKKTKPNTCIICGQKGGDAAHLLPRSTFPEYYTEPNNIVIMCRDCHCNFDDNISFRQQQTKLIESARTYATKEEIHRYFDID